MSEPRTDAEKLRVLATWFDHFDDWREATGKIAPGISEYRDVQNDLRRIADRIEAEAALPVPAAVYAAVKAVPQPLSTSEALERLRAWTGLTTTGIAELLGVARRSLYHWTSAGVRPRQEGRLLNLVEAIEPYAGRVESWQLRDALVSSDAREAVADGDREAIRLVVEQTIERRPHRLRRAGGEASAEPAPIGMAELREYLHGVSAPVRRDRAATYVPRELSDSERCVTERRSWINALLIYAGAALAVYHGRIGYQNPDNLDILALGEVLFPERVGRTRPDEVKP